MAGSKKRKSKKATQKELPIASPTAAAVLEQFLDEQRQRLAPSTMRQYESVIELLQACMQNYAWDGVNGDPTELSAAYEAAGLTFCEAFGPEHIGPNIGGFLSWFMPRKVMCGESLIRTAGTVTRKLEKWLADNGYASGEESQRQREYNRESAKASATARKVERLLDQFIVRTKMRRELHNDSEPPPKRVEVEEGRFEICRIEEGKLWLAEWLDGDQHYGPFVVPAEITKLCEDGWTLSGLIGRIRQGDRLEWRILELWSLTP